MAADLSAYSLFQRRELILEEDALLELESQFGSDRIKRILFDRIQSLSAWTQVLAGRLVISAIIIVIGLVFLLPLITNTKSDMVPLGVILVTIGIITFLRYASVHRYYLVIRMLDESEIRITALSRPVKFRRFVKRLVDGIAEFQEKEGERRSIRGSTDTRREAMEPLGS